MRIDHQRLLLIACLFLLPFWVHAEDSVDIPGLACRALGQAVAFAQAVATGEAAPAGLIKSKGVVVWQQPGVALVAEQLLTSAGQTEDLIYAQERCAEFLRNTQRLSCGTPFVRPGEQGNTDEFYVEPQVYLLNQSTAQQRLGTYVDGYHYWLELNPGLEYVDLTASDLEVAFAVVFLDSSGPVEFHFVLEEDELVLRHFFHWAFFSA